MHKTIIDKSMQYDGVKETQRLSPTEWSRLNCEPEISYGL